MKAELQRWRTRGPAFLAVVLLALASVLAGPPPERDRLPGGGRGGRPRDEGRRGPRGPRERPAGRTVELPETALGTDPMAAGVILGRPTDRTVTASLLSAQPLEIRLEHRPAQGNVGLTTVTVQLEARTPRELQLQGLEPDSRYLYRVFSRPPGGGAFTRGEERTFHTRRKPGSPFLFVVQADPHGRDPNTSQKLYERTLGNMLADRPDFVVDLGDTFMGDKFSPPGGDVAVFYEEQRPLFGLLCHSASLFLVNGNHEGEAGFEMRDALAARAAAARRRFYPAPLPGDLYVQSQTVEPVLGPRDTYYAWEWGDALLVVLDPYRYTTSKPRHSGDPWDWTLGQEQYTWLRGVLEASRARFKFVFAHQLAGGADLDGRGGVEQAPFCEWGGKNPDGSWGFDMRRPGWPQPVHQLLASNRVSVFFHGHDHLYARQELDGVVYQETPQPSHRAPEEARSASEYGYVTGELLGGSGHLRVRVAPGQATVEYVRSCLPEDERDGRQNGGVVASYELRPPRLEGDRARRVPVNPPASTAGP